MCGLFGCIKFRGRFLREDFGRFVSLTDLVSYRGPDDSGYVGLISANGLTVQLGETLQPFDIFLGHRRLSIIDLSSAGRQPMTDGQGRWIIFNGEIFNFVELREELKALGCNFRTETDTEVILHLYDRFGESAFGKMNGMWALAIADLRSRRLVLSRDRFSIKPMYLFSHNDEFYFASEIKQLLPLLPKTEPNIEILAAFLAQGLLDHSLETFFRRITKAPPMMNVVVNLSNGTVETASYWDYGRRAPRSLADSHEEFRELMIDSTRLRLRSDVKVGLLLSGGLDSSALAVAARRAGAEQLLTYSVVSDEPNFNEEPFIDEVNQSVGLKGIKFCFRVPHVEEALLQVLHHSDEPFAGFSVVAQYGMFRTIKENSAVTVLLSGQGGDEVLLGYLKFFFFHLRDLVRQRRYGMALNQIVSSAIRGTVFRQFRLSEAKRYIPFLRMDGRSVLRNDYDPVRVGPGDGMRSRQIADIESFSIPALTHYEDRNSMAHSLEVRHPFLDHRVVEFGLSLPPEWQFSRGWTKSFLRQSFPDLPDAVRWRKDKQPFTTPEELWLKRDLSGFVNHTFQKSVLDELGLFNSGIFLQQYSSFRRGSPLVSFGDISRGLIAETWAQQQWGQNSSVRAERPQRIAEHVDSQVILRRPERETTT